MDIESKRDRPKTLNLQPPKFEFHEMSETTDYHQTQTPDDEKAYIQIQPLQKYYSAPNMLSVTSPYGQNPSPVPPRTDMEQRSLSSPYILEGYSKRKSIYQDLPQKKEYYSLFFLGPRNPIRRLAVYITEAKYPFHDLHYFREFNRSILRNIVRLVKYLLMKCKCFIS